MPLFQTGPETCEPWAPHRTRYVAIEETIAVDEVGVGPRQPNVAAGLYIFHHLKEEEEEMFPKVRKVIPEAELKELGEKLLARKKELLGERV